jgi:hypothetical protein
MDSADADRLATQNRSGPGEAPSGWHPVTAGFRTVCGLLPLITGPASLTGWHYPPALQGH